MSKVSVLIVALNRIGKIKIISKQVFHTPPVCPARYTEVKTPLVELEIDMLAHLNLQNNILKAPQSHSVYTLGEAGVQIIKNKTSYIFTFRSQMTFLFILQNCNCIFSLLILIVKILEYNLQCKKHAVYMATCS